MQEGYDVRADAWQRSDVRLGVPPNNDRLFELYRWANLPAFEIDACDKTEDSSTGVNARVLSFNDIMITRASSSALRYQRNERVIAHGGISDFLIEIFRSDRVVARIEGREIEMRTGDIVILDLTRQSEITADRHDIVVVTLRRFEIERFVSNPDSLHGTVLKANSPLARMLTSYIQLLEAEAPKLEAGDAAALASSAAALVGHCFGAKAHDAQQTKTAIAPSLFSLVRLSIDRALGDPNLDVDFLARKHGVSRSSLYRMFEPYGGVNTFIRQSRLRRIYRDLSSPDRRQERITSIAFRWGFTSEVTFSRAFKSAFGISARDLRNAVERTGLSAQDLAGADRNAFRRLRGLLDQF